MITNKKILAAGYKEFPVSSIDKCSRNWAKQFYSHSPSEVTKLYQIVIQFWNFEQYSGPPALYNAKVCFEYPNNSTAWITYQADSIEEIEEFFSNLFHKTGAIAYDKLNN